MRIRDEKVELLHTRQICFSMSSCTKVHLALRYVAFRPLNQSSKPEER